MSIQFIEQFANIRIAVWSKKQFIWFFAMIIRSRIHQGKNEIPKKVILKEN